MEGYYLIAEEAARLANRLPASVIETVVARLEGSDGSDSGYLEGTGCPCHPHARLSGKRSFPSSTDGVHSPGSFSSSRRSSPRNRRFIVKKRREEEAVEVVWTGPDQDVIPLRRTEQAILQVSELRSEPHPDRELRRLFDPEHPGSSGPSRQAGGYDHGC